MVGEREKRTILVADDSTAQRRLLELILSAHNFTVITAEDGRQALTYLRANTPDLMILDVNMPHMNGIELCKRAKSTARLSGVPVIIMTSLTDTETRNHAQAANADLLITKPLKGKNLSGMISELLAAGG